MDLVYLILIIILLVCVINTFLTKNDLDKVENFTASNLDSEALQNIASIYNNQNLTVTNMNVTGRNTVSNLTVSGTFNLLPPGSIIMFNGAAAPSGWALCDGQNGRPDLRGRFVLGAGAGPGLTSRGLGAKGGEENHVLTVAEMPSHTHTYTDAYYKSTKVNGSDFNDQGASGYNYATRTSNPTGGDQGHNTMPPFYVLTYIIKL